jgi:hypothetical protein
MKIKIIFRIYLLILCIVSSLFIVWKKKDSIIESNFFIGLTLILTLILLNQLSKKIKDEKL